MKRLALLLIVGTSSVGLTISPGSPFSAAVVQARVAENKESAGTPPVGAPSQSSMPPEEAARSFYRWYLHALYQSPTADPFKARKVVVEQYVTERLLRKLANSRATSTVEKGPDVDTAYFFGTLDLSSEWEKNINASAPTTKGPAAVVHITFSGTAENRRRLDIELERKVVLIQEEGLWRIDEAGVWRQ